MVYLDNAATSFPKPKSVIKEVIRCLSDYCGNPGRSSFGISLTASERIYEARERVSELLFFDYPTRIIFTQNATHGLNIAIKGLINEPCHVIISDLEHNSVLRPLYKTLHSLGGEISVFDSDKNIVDAVLPLLRDDTKVIISTLASNVTGKIVDYKALSKLSRKKGIKLILDASQLLGHKVFHYNDCPADCIVAPGHKGLFGLQGSGILLIGKDARPDTLTEGGNGYDTLNTGMADLLPERYEAGTLATPAIVGLSEGIRYIQEIGLPIIEEKIDMLTMIAYDILHSFRDIDVYGGETGIISFNFRDAHSSSIAEALSLEGIMTRSGLHCSPLIHKKLGTLDKGAVRISLSYFNDKKDLDRLFRALKNLDRIK